MPYGLTHIQKEVLDFIKAYIRQEGVSPTYQTIADEMGLKSKGRVAEIVKKIEERGHIKRSPHRAQSITIISPRCPHCGREI